MSIILDAGALVAVERGDRDVIALIKRERQAGRPPLTHGGVVGQVWRGGHGRQAVLARVLSGLDVHALDDSLGRQAGVLLGRTDVSDVVDAAVVLLADDGDEIITSDVADLRELAEAAGMQVDLIPA
ncbi:hypothetical protein BH23ACT10_BH23ACT10_38490 [soil metagenome]